MPTVNLSDAVWRKSSRSGSQNANCVEIAAVRDAVAVRDSKDKDGGKLVFTPREWTSFLDGVKRGAFDQS